MQSVNIVKTRAAKLHEILGTMGYPLKHSRCLDIVLEIEKQASCKTHAPAISDNRSIAEQYLDEIVEAFMEQTMKKQHNILKKSF